MQCITIFVAAIFCAVVCTMSVSSRCGCLEEPATGNKRRDKYCRPHLVPKSERQKHRNCICRPGFVRNSWGDCITNKECMNCKCHPNKDFNVCARACPVMCNEPIRTSCSKECVFGCDCPPGFVRDGKRKNRCVKAAKCTLRCPAHSKFQFCLSTCAPKCGQRMSTNCATRCQRGGCVCDPGYAEVEHNGDTICVPLGECSRYIAVRTPIPAGRPGLVGGGFSSVGGAGGSSMVGIGSTTTGIGATSRGELGTLSGKFSTVGWSSHTMTGSASSGSVGALPGAGAGGAMSGSIVGGGHNFNTGTSAGGSAVVSNVGTGRRAGSIAGPIAGAVLGGLATAGVGALAAGLTGMGGAGHRVGRPCVGTRCGSSAISSGRRSGCVRCNLRNWG
uniref:Putative tritil protein n=1 Tax=Rhipicephalus pulchellus TaxID=72859 RepID=L7LRC0_RHIPC